MVSALKNEIFVGSLTNPLYHFDNDTIFEVPMTQAVALVGQELSIDTFMPIVSDRTIEKLKIAHFRSSDGKEIETALGQIYAIDVEDDPDAVSMLDIPDETPLWYYHNGKLAGKFYVMDVRRQGRNKYQLNCVSAVGLLDNKYHGGGLFLATTFGVVLRHILAAGLWGDGDPVISYEIDDEVAELPVSGWLPHASKRNNLYQLMFANGINIIKNIDGNPRFTFVYKPPLSSAPISDENIYYGGTVEYTKPYSQVSVLEHTYVALTGVESVTLFDNTEGAAYNNTQVWFENAPVIVSTIEASSGLSVISVTENGAVVSGNGVLTGIPYTHTTRTVSKINHSIQEEKTVSVSDCTMVNLINSENLLNRLYAFYCSNNFIKLIKNSIKYTDERCGKAYDFHNPYMENTLAFLASMTADATSLLKADCEFYAGYEPAGQQGLYSHVIILPISEDDPVIEGDIEIPEEAETIKVVMIGGGTGGYSGWPGKNGGDAIIHTEIATTDDLSAVRYGAEGGDGGAGGPGGAPGRVKIITIDNPARSYHYTLGQGGDGGLATGFIPDTVEELRAALKNEYPDDEYTDEQIEAMIAQENTNWNGQINVGEPGTATTFGEWSTDDADAEIPVGGVYAPIIDQYFALTGKQGIHGGKGGARKVQNGTNFVWATDGENVMGDSDENGNRVTYQGGRTGDLMTTVPDLPEVSSLAFGGNGAGAAVGIDRDNLDYVHINGGSDQSASWYVLEDE